MYYLQSRYYDPEIGRFLNADALISTGQGFLGNNMFAYCRNNPVSRKDASGTEDVCAEDVNQDNNPLNDLGNPTGSGGGGSPGYAYSAPPGGGGPTSSIKVGGTTVSFGHGGRHMDFRDISGLESAIANDVVTQPPTTGTSISMQIVYSGVDFTYRYFTLSSTHIHVGTYYYTVAK